MKLLILDLSFNKIKYIKNISYMYDLKIFFFVVNKISKIEGFEGLDKFILLEFGFN